jgi:ABC-type sugar transport system ATPase subunit
MAEVRLENVTKKYGQKVAVKDVNITFKEGELSSIVGPAGAGKSTILKMIAGIEDPTSGTIYFNEQPVNALPPQKRNVAMAFESYNLYPHMSVYENIAFPLTTPEAKASLTRQQRREKVEEIADFLGIKRLFERKPVELSGGQKQRVSLARAMVRKAQVYLLDEPIAHLDARLKFSTQKSLKRMSRKMGTAIIYVTHDYREALGLSDRVAVLNNGKLEQVGTPKEIFHKPATDFVARFIGDPPTNLIDGEILEIDGRICFRTSDFQIDLQKDLSDRLGKVQEEESDTSMARMGIRSYHIRVTKEKESKNAFQLPIYAMARTPAGTLLTFEMENSFLQASLVDHPRFEMSEKVWLDLDPDHILFFRKSIKLSKL